MLELRYVSPFIGYVSEVSEVGMAERETKRISQRQVRECVGG